MPLTQPRHTRDSDTIFKVKGEGHQAALLSAALTRKAAAAVSVGTGWAWEPLHHIQGFVRRRALHQNSSHRDYARSLASVPSATSALRRGTHFLATSAVQLRHRHLKHCSNLIFFAKLLTLFSTFKFYIVGRLCPKFY